MASILTCRLGTGDDSSVEQIIVFRPDGQKKSAYWLDPCSPVPSPGTLVIDADDKVFFMGGFSLISGAKSIEIYLQVDDKENYLTTCRGIPAKDHPGCFKVVTVVPGGARPVSRVRLKLVGAGETVDVKEMRLTARIPETTAPLAAGGAVPTTAASPAASPLPRGAFGRLPLRL